MFKNLFKLSVILTLALFVTASGTFASGKMEVSFGEKVTLQAGDPSGGTYKWVAKKGKEIISTQSSSIFNYTFDQQGEYEVLLTVTDSAGKTKSTVVQVLVGDRYSSREPAEDLPGSGDLGVSLSVGLETLPIKTSQKTVYILGEEGRVVFDIGTRDDILEYRIDRNIYVDSDGNGIANDDIDNADHSSYLLGGMWQTKYLASESNKIAAEVVVVSKQGKKAKTQVEIIFDSLPEKTGNVIAVMDTLPVPDTENNRIYLYDDIDTVAFYGRRSSGDILEYRIDKNIFVDSDLDGNPSNDIDNRTDPSFRSGDVWTTAYNKTDGQIIAQMIAVGRGGAGSRIQREIVFTDRPPVSDIEVTLPDTGIRLTSDKEFVQKGDPIQFAVEGLQLALEEYVLDWDFNGDGEVDQTIEGANTVSYIYDTPGVQMVKVGVADSNGNKANFSLDLLVKDIAQTTADFDFTVEDNKVVFNNLSVSNPNLTSKTLTYTWSFGDTDPDSYEAQKDQIGVQNPVYTYTKAGTYIVTLTVVDIDQVSSSQTAEVLIETVPGAETDTENGGKTELPSEKGGGSIIWTILKVFFYIILAVVLLVVLIVAGLLVFLKIQHPDLIFEELIDELKIKILAMLGIHDMIEAEPERPNVPAASDEVITPAVREPDEESDVETPVASEPELAKEDAPVPDWLKNPTPANLPAQEPEVIEGESEEVSDQSVVSEPVTEPESSSEDESPPEPPVEQAGQADGVTTKQNEGPVPDWLKNV